MALSPELCKKMYTDMWRIRLFEEEANRQTSLGSVGRCPSHVLWGRSGRCRRLF